MLPRLLQRRLLNYVLLEIASVVAWCNAMLLPLRAEGAERSTSTARSVANTSAESARTATLNECVDAHASAQELRRSGQLLKSRAKLLECSKEVCPELVRTECLSILDQLRLQVPSVVFHVTVDDESSSDAQALMDGEMLFSEVPSRAMDVDPGKHVFEFRHGNLAPVKRQVTITEGDERVPVTVQFATPTPVLIPRAPAESQPEAEHRSVPLPVYVLSAVGTLGLGGFVGLALATRSKENELRWSCSPGCSQSQVDSVQKRALMADISLGVGLLAFASVATYYVVRSENSVRVGAAWLPNGRVHSQLAVDF